MKKIQRVVLLMGIWAWISLTASAQFETVSVEKAVKTPTPTVEAVTESEMVAAGTTFRMAVIITLSPALHINAHEPGDPYLVPTTITFSPPEGFSVRQTAYPQPTTITLEGGKDSLRVYEGRVVLGLVVSIADGILPGDYVLPGTLRYQACDNKQCFPPQKAAVSCTVKVVPKGSPITLQQSELFKDLVFEDAAPVQGIGAVAPKVPDKAVLAEDWHALVKQLTITGSTDGYVNSKAFLGFLDAAEQGTQPVTGTAFAGKSVWWVLFVVLGGGLLLNLTPCVLPLIPINLAILGAGAKAGSRGRGFALGGAYGLGIALAYGVLGILVVLGLSETFGGINGNPWFNGVIAALFLVLALAMFDIIMIDFTRYQGKVGIRKGSGLVTAFAMGGISALLAGACVAPVLISTLLYAQDQYAQGNVFALFLPFLLGLGMALPWPFAGAGLSFLPKPGRWMTRVKQAFGLLILGFAVYYGHLAYKLYTEREAVLQTRSVEAGGDWHTQLAPAFAESIQSGKPVLIDLWATWCKNCLVMEATTFKNTAVQERLGDFVKVKFQAEDMSDPATSDVMKYFEVLGLPKYIVLKPKPAPSGTP